MNKDITHRLSSNRHGRSCLARVFSIATGFLLAASVFGVSPAVAQEQSAAGDQEVAGGGFEVFRGRSEGVGGVSSGSVNPRIAPADGPFAVGTRWK